MRIAFARQNGLENGLSGHPADIAQYIGQLDTHLRERLLYPLDVRYGCPYEIVALPPVGAHRADLLRRPERIPQQTVGVQLHQPLALLHVASCTSLFRPGRPFVSRALTRYTSKPAASRMSYTAIQYTPVDCIATVRIPHRFSHSAMAFSSTVVHPKHRTGWLSRVGGTAT